MIFDRRAKPALIVACLTLIVCAVGFRAAIAALNIYLKKEPVSLRDNLSDIPRRLGQWEAAPADVQLAKEMVEELGTEQYLNRSYFLRTKTGSCEMGLHIAYYTGMIDSIPHVPDRCMVAAGFDAVSRPQVVSKLSVNTAAWIPSDVPPNRATGIPYSSLTYSHYITGKPVTVHMPIDDLGLRFTEFARKLPPKIDVFSGFFFVANGRTTPIPEDIRALAFDRTDRYAYYCKVQFTMVRENADADADVFQQRVTDLLQSLLPELMRCLPDWPEIEARSAEKPVPPSVDQKSASGSRPGEAASDKPVQWAKSKTASGSSAIGSRRSSPPRRAIGLTSDCLLSISM
jgi:hypothetical protein